MLRRRVESARNRHASAQTDPPNPLAREIFRQLIEINTTDSVGNVTTAAEAMAVRLRDAGFTGDDVIVDGPSDPKKNLVARIHGTGQRKPILFIGHLDVVEARRENWTTDPFKFIEKDGYFYGRGTDDMKEADAILVNNFIRMKKRELQARPRPDPRADRRRRGRQIHGVDWLVKNHRDWIDAEYCINLDGGEFEKNGSQRILTAIQASEKVYADFQLESLNPGGTVRCHRPTMRSITSPTPSPKFRRSHFR